MATWCEEQKHTRKDPDAGKDWGQEEKGATEDEMVGWHLQLNEQQFEQTSGDSRDRESWHAAVHGITKSRTWLSYWTTTLRENMELFMICVVGMYKYLKIRKLFILYIWFRPVELHFLCLNNDMRE